VSPRSARNTEKIVYADGEKLAYGIRYGVFLKYTAPSVVLIPPTVPAPLYVAWLAVVGTALRAFPDLSTHVAIVAPFDGTAPLLGSEPSSHTWSPAISVGAPTAVYIPVVACLMMITPLPPLPPGG
jgi:hypothetical protein